MSTLVLFTSTWRAHHDRPDWHDRPLEPAILRAGNLARAEIGARYLTTWPHGAVTIRQSGAAFVVETFHTRHRWAIR